MPPVFYWLGEYTEMGLRWLSSQFKIWYLFFNKRARQSIARSWSVIRIYETVILLLYAVSIVRILSLSHGAIPEPGTFENMNVLLIMVMIVPAIILGIGALAILFILSLFPWGKKTADKIFKYSESTELEKLKSETEKKLNTLEERLTSVESTMNDRLKNIEGNLKTLAGRTDNIGTPLKTKTKSKRKAKKR